MIPTQPRKPQAKRITVERLQQISLSDDMKLPDARMTLEEAMYTMNCDDGVVRTLEIFRIIYHADSIKGPSPTVFEARCIKEEGLGRFKSWKEKSLILKFSLPVQSRAPENVLIDEARACAKEDDHLALYSAPPLKRMHSCWACWQCETQERESRRPPALTHCWPLPAKPPSNHVEHLSSLCGSLK
ncbi:hypothetical protein GYMLUDRAFT_58954 [Collybiopsis luxurians FD-317 M1]|uniref:Uncharacterized protein n=1 Tax=Collybiopsis luxurians FD-317 M1 TaxID=944289 RepID=A0A0D0CFX1_9AGAR|nr:hypothetical protein GYMLUDRAFT_58954 [Collybiopsis luxurians FD-317 M1]